MACCPGIILLQSPEALTVACLCLCVCLPLRVLCVGVTASLLVSGDPDKGRPLADQETLATSLNRLVGLLGQAQQYVDDVVVSVCGGAAARCAAVSESVCSLQGPRLVWPCSAHLRVCLRGMV